MNRDSKKRFITYRCPECYAATTGIVGKFTLGSTMIRLKCGCDKNSSLDMEGLADGKIKLSVPCIFCKQNHSYTVSDTLFMEREAFRLSCPYSGMDIAFLGDEDGINADLERTEKEIGQLLGGLEADDISDIQPTEMNDEEILPDPAVYDTIRFLVKDLEEEGAIKCLCDEGKYDLRFTSEGVQVYCENCGASFDFKAMSPTMAEEYLSLDSLKLT